MGAFQAAESLLESKAGKSNYQAIATQEEYDHLDEVDIDTIGDLKPLKICQFVDLPCNESLLEFGTRLHSFIVEENKECKINDIICIIAAARVAQLTQTELGDKINENELFEWRIVIEKKEEAKYCDLLLSAIIESSFFWAAFAAPKGSCDGIILAPRKV